MSETGRKPVAVFRYLIFYGFCIPRVAENLLYETGCIKMWKTQDFLL